MQDTSEVLSGTVYIPDTSALIENPDALDHLLTGGNIVVVLHQVLEELGRLQTSRTKPDGVRHAARQVTRKMLEYRRRQLINHGVEQILNHQANPEVLVRTPAGGVLAWEPATALEEPYSEDLGDNHSCVSGKS